MKLAILKQSVAVELPYVSHLDHHSPPPNTTDVASGAFVTTFDLLSSLITARRRPYRAFLIATYEKPALENFIFFHIFHISY